MKKKKEIKYLKKLMNKMQQHFNEFIQTQEPEALHQFRVQVKKTSSFLTLLDAGSKNRKLLKVFKPVKKIFSLTGEIRDAHLHIEQAKENHVQATQLFKEQNAQQQDETARLLQHHHSYLHKIKKVKKQLQHCVNKTSSTEILQFIQQQLHNTTELLHTHNFTEQLHNGRKMLKHLLYNRHIIPAVIAKEVNINFDYVDEMQQVIGNWHDNKLALEYFNNKLPANQLALMKQKQLELQQTVTLKADSFGSFNLQ